MGGSDIAINSVGFWVIAAAAVVVLNLLRTSPARPYAFAAVNIAVLAMLLHWLAVAVVAAIAAVFVLLRLPGRKVSISVLSVGILILFVVHKSAILRSALDLQITMRVLAAIGFSFVALRLVELLRAMAERRYPPPSLPALVNYLVPFHMLAAGPIQSYDDFVSQPTAPPAPGSRDVLEGAERIANGLFKKFVLAYALHTLFLTDLRSDGIYFFIEVQVLLLWLYLDFSAYSDIAVGIGRLAGIATPENFRAPLKSRNLIEFWDRWHISLSQFIRRNLFIPIQLFLMRRSAASLPIFHASIATLIAFTLAGVWHGLAIGWFVWGCMHAAGLVVVRLYGVVLQRHLGSGGLRTYRANPIISALATLLTYEYAAFAFVPTFLWTRGL